MTTRGYKSTLIHCRNYVDVAAVIFVRHGESVSNTNNIITSDYKGFPLTETGKRQAAEAAGELKNIHVDYLLTSPVQRAQETAEIISRAVGVNASVDERIRESGMGPHNNKSLNEIPKKKRSELGMESWESHQERFLSAMNDVEGVTLMVSHAFPIRSAVAHFLDLDEDESYGINIRNGSITVIDLDSGKVLCIGSRHLSPKVRKYLLGEK